MTSQYSRIHITRRHDTILLLIIIGWLSSAVPAYGDGGAPNLAYVAGAQGGVAVIDIAQQKVVRTLQQVPRASMIQLKSDGSSLYVIQSTENHVQILDPATDKLRCTADLPVHPTLISLSRQEDALFVAGANDAHIYSIDPVTCKRLHTISTPGPVTGLTTSLAGGAFPEHTGLYQICAATSGQITIFDSDGKTLDSIKLSATPQFLSAPPGFLLYATTRQGTVITIDLAKQQPIKTLLANGSFGPMDYDETTGEIYVPDQAHHQVAVLLPGNSNAHQVPVRSITLNSIPTHVAITSDGQLGFIALQDGHVAMLDVPAHKIMATIYVGGSPDFIITGLYPPRPDSESKPSTLITTTAITLREVILLIFAIIFFLALLGLVIIGLLWLKKPQHRS